MHYFVYYINILLTRRSRLNSRLKKRTCCHSFMALNRASDVQQLIGYLKHMGAIMVIRFFSVVEIPVKHSSLYNKKNTTVIFGLKLC